MQGPELTIQGDTAHGIERQMQPRELMTALMLRTWSETLLAGVYLLTHTALREQWEGPLEVQVANQWQQVQPSTWAGREIVAVSVDQGAGAKARESMTLQALMALQAQMFQAGGQDTLVGAAQIYDAAVDWGRASGLSDPAKYLIDPRSPPAQAAAAQQKQQAQQQAAAQGAIMQAIAELQAGVEAWKIETENSFKYYDAALKAYIEEAKIIGTGTAQLEAVALGGMVTAAQGRQAAEAVDPNRQGGLDAADGARVAGEAAGNLPGGGVPGPGGGPGGGLPGAPTFAPITLGRPKGMASGSTAGV
jgi:hypothetical protein